MVVAAVALALRDVAVVELFYYLKLFYLSEACYRVVGRQAVALWC